VRPAARRPTGEDAPELGQMAEAMRKTTERPPAGPPELRRCPLRARAV